MSQLTNAEISALQERFKTQHFAKYGDKPIPGIMGWGVGLHKVGAEFVLGVKIIAIRKRALRGLPDTFEGLPVFKLLTAGPARLDRASGKKTRPHG
jgi:hypothetical protein